MGYIYLMLFVMLLCAILPFALNSYSPKNTQVFTEVKIEPNQVAVCTLSLEVSRVSWGTEWYYWMAYYRGKPIKRSEEWAATGNQSSAGEALKSTDRFRKQSAPAFWKMVQELEADGWRPVYKSDGEIDSMVKGEVQVTEDGHIIPLDPGFSLTEAVPSGSQPEPQSVLPAEVEPVAIDTDADKAEEWRRRAWDVMSRWPQS